MTTVFELTGFVKDGELKLRNRKALQAWAATLKDCEVVVTIEKAHATRSLAQNAFWHGVVVKAFSEHCGYRPTEMHDVLKLELLPEKRLLHDGNGEVLREVIVGGSTARLTKIEFGELIERAQQLGAEMGILIPNPNEVAA
jgi:uncharacterized protein (UPF0179 family)